RGSADHPCLGEGTPAERHNRPERSLVPLGVARREAREIDGRRCWRGGHRPAASCEEHSITLMLSLPRSGMSETILFTDSPSTSEEVASAMCVASKGTRSGSVASKSVHGPSGASAPCVHM